MRLPSQRAAAYTAQARRAARLILAAFGGNVAHLGIQGESVLKLLRGERVAEITALRVAAAGARAQRALAEAGRDLDAEHTAGNHTSWFCAKTGRDLMARGAS